MICKCFLTFHGLSFHFPDSILRFIKGFNLDEIQFIYFFFFYYLCFYLESITKSIVTELLLWSAKSMIIFFLTWWIAVTV
jgi:hypothetical protein